MAWWRCWWMIGLMVAGQSGSASELSGSAGFFARPTPSAQVESSSYQQFKLTMQQQLAEKSVQLQRVSQQMQQEPLSSKQRQVRQRKLQQLQALRDTLVNKLDFLGQVSPEQYADAQQVFEHNYQRLCYQLNKLEVD